MESGNKEISVLMVCLGNICRSPTAEGVLRKKLQDAGLQGRVSVDSAGTCSYHVGDPPDERSIEHARRRGYDLSSLRARQLVTADFGRFDLLLAMDWDNYAELQDECPVESSHKLHRLMEFAGPQAPDIVPDPYHGGSAGFELVLDRVEQACSGLVAHIRERLAIAA